MKNKFIDSIIAGVVLLTSLSASAFDVPTQTLLQSSGYQADTNAFPLTLTNSANASLTGLKYQLRQDHGLSVFATVVSTNAASVAATLKFDVTYDGTNGSTTQPITWTLPSNFVGTNTYWTNWPSTTLNNCKTLSAAVATNTAVGTGNTNTVVVSALVYSQSNK